MSATQVGEQLLRTLRPALKDISAELMALGDMRDKPAGTVRITTFRYAAMRVLLPVLPGFLATDFNVRVEVSLDDDLKDIVDSGFDAGAGATPRHQLPFCRQWWAPCLGV